jgi:DNA-3-methyladenine glycosylase
MSDAFGFLNGPAWEAAPRLLGCEIVRTLDGRTLRGRIVETEAYDQTDAASHSYKGRTPRTDVMFGPSGHLYVYFTYGMHYCCNIVTGRDGYGSAVLIRAIEPIVGEELMTANRNGLAGVNITNGPAKLCQAFSIDKRLNGHDLQLEPLTMGVMPAINQQDVIQTTRIGINNAKDVPWRFYLKGNPYISKS